MMKARFAEPTDGRYLEQSEVKVVVSFVNDSGVLEAPAELSYRIDNPDTGEEVLTWTTVTPAETVTITITPAQNEIANRNLAIARRQLVLRGANSATLGRKIYTLDLLRGLG